METIKKEDARFDDSNPFCMESKIKYEKALEVRFLRLKKSADLMRADGLLTDKEWMSVILSLRKKLGLTIGIFNDSH